MISSPDEEGKVGQEGDRPEYIYINLKPVFTSAVLTVPRLDVDLPENVDSQPKPVGNTVIVLRNNGRFKLSPAGTGFNGLNTDADFSKQPIIDSVRWGNETYTGDDLLSRKRELLGKFFREILESDDNVRVMRAANEAVGLKGGSYLYRAVDKYDWVRLLRERAKVYSHLDPSANFESETMFQGEHSQAKHYATQTDHDYSGRIIRWKIEDPLLYRRAGMMPPRVIPMFSHFLPAEIEVSKDLGKTFKPLPV